MLFLLTPCLTFSQSYKIGCEEDIYIKGTRVSSCFHERGSIAALLGKPDSLHLHRFEILGGGYTDYDSTFCYRDASFIYDSYRKCYFISQIRFSAFRKDFSASFGGYKLSCRTSMEDVAANFNSYERPDSMIFWVPDGFDRKSKTKYIEVFPNGGATDQPTWIFCFCRDKLFLIYEVRHDA
jgi:hypothetical protein